MNTQQSDIWKRDLDLIRSILLRLEQGEMHLLNKESFLDMKLKNHLRILIEAELVKGSVTGSENSHYIVIVGPLTWTGYELLDSIRPPEVYDRIQSGVKKAGGWALPIIQNFAVEIMKKTIEG